MRADPDKPPLFSSWTRVYALVLGNLLGLILLFWGLTRILS